VGYGWLMRGTYVFGAMAAGLGAGGPGDRPGAGAGRGSRWGSRWPPPPRWWCRCVRRKAAGVSGQREHGGAPVERVAAMTGIEPRRAALRQGGRRVPAGAGPGGAAASGWSAWWPAASTPAATGVALAGARASGRGVPGAVTDAMLLGHWYLVQPGLPRRCSTNWCGALGWIWPVEVIACCCRRHGVGVNGTIDDGWGGSSAGSGSACAITTMVLVVVTRRRSRSAVLGGDGGHRPALPGHPHRVRHRPRRPGRPRRLMHRAR
jgi:hypothetical protein